LALLLLSLGIQLKDMRNLIEKRGLKLLESGTQTKAIFQKIFSMIFKGIKPSLKGI